MGWRDRYFEVGYLKRWALSPPDEARFEVAAGFLALGDVPSTARVLDLGCGHGAYALALAKAGADVFALDASSALLRRAQAHSEGRSYSARWIRGDMRAIPFGRHFDLVIIISAFGYFDAEDEDLLLLREVGRVLRPAGCLILENPNATRIRENFRPLIEEHRNACTISLNSTLDEQGRWMDQHVVIEDDDGVEEYERRHRLYSAQELEQLLHDAGFTLIGHFADAAGAPFAEETSTHLLTVGMSSQAPSPGDESHG